MPQYIDKSALIAEIERIKKEECPIDTYEGRCKLLWFEQFLSFLDTLEVKEEVFDTNDIKDAFKSGYDMGVLQTTKKINSNIKKVDLENSIICKVDWYDGFLLDYTQEQQDKLLEKIGANVGDKIRVILIKE